VRPKWKQWKWPATNKGHKQTKKRKFQLGSESEQPHTELCSKIFWYYFLEMTGKFWETSVPVFDNKKWSLYILICRIFGQKILEFTSILQNTRNRQIHKRYLVFLFSFHCSKFRPGAKLKDPGFLIKKWMKNLQGVDPWCFFC
jgi:hypothetical protein